MGGSSSKGGGGGKNGSGKDVARPGAGGHPARNQQTEAVILPKPEPEPEPEPPKTSFYDIEKDSLETILSYLEAKPKLLLVSKSFQAIIGNRRKEELDNNYAMMKETGKKIQKSLFFVEQYSIHRSSPLVQNLKVIDQEDLGDTELKDVSEDIILEEGRVIPLRRQTQLSNFSESWRIAGTDSEKVDIFCTTFEHLWNSLQMKRWINRDDIIWIDQKNENVSKTVNQLFDTLRDVRENLDAFKKYQKACMWHILAQEHAAAVAFEKEKKMARKKQEVDAERKRKAGAFILDYRK